jgi:N-methylhydantoinase A/oxoprolinase/acetone carboxylase beta subunit
MTELLHRPTAPWRIGVDVGGTFTDLVLADDNGDTWVAKVPSVPLFNALLSISACRLATY